MFINCRRLLNIVASRTYFLLYLDLTLKPKQWEHFTNHRRQCWSSKCMTDFELILNHISMKHEYVACLHYVRVSCLTDIHTPNPTFPTMQGQTLSSEAHWDIFQNSSSTGCCPPAHIQTHTQMAHSHGHGVRASLSATPPARFGSLCNMQAEAGGRTEGYYTIWGAHLIEMTPLLSLSDDI